MPEDKSSNQSQPVATTDPLTCATELTKPSAPPNSTPTVRSSSLTHEMSDEEVMAFFHSHADRCEARWLPRETRKLGAKDIKTVLSGYGINSYKSRDETLQDEGLGRGPPAPKYYRYRVLVPPETDLSRIYKINSPHERSFTPEDFLNSFPNNRGSISWTDPNGTFQCSILESGKPADSARRLILHVYNAEGMSDFNKYGVIWVEKWDSRGPEKRAKGKKGRGAGK